MVVSCGENPSVTLGFPAQRASDLKTVPLPWCHLYVAVVYLTLTVCISTVSILVQMIVLNMYYIEPAPPMPKWLRKLTQTLSMVCKPYRVSPSIVSDRNDLLSSIMVTDKVANSLGNNAHALPPCFDNLSLINALILVEMRTMTSHMKTEKTDSALQEQWKYSARLLDRLFLCLFGIYQITSIFVIFIILHQGAKWKWIYV